MKSMNKDTNWLDQKTTLYNNSQDIAGTARTLRQVLKSDFGMKHNICIDHEGQIIDGSCSDLEICIEMRKLNPTDPGFDHNKKLLKKCLQAFTPSAYISTREKGVEKTIIPTGLLQIDFDNINGDIEALKAMIFELPFVAFVSKSSSGAGLFALILIAEPERLKEYAEHCFAVFKYYGLPVDPSKGRNYTDLRFLSYDANMLLREHPVPLKIKRFHTIQRPVTTTHFEPTTQSKNRLINWAVNKIQNSVIGNRWHDVQKIAWTLGGYQTGLPDIENAIINSPQFAGMEEKYLKCARVCFREGSQKPFVAHA